MCGEERTSQRLQRFRDLVDVAGDLDLVPDLGDHALLVDQEGGALDAHVLAAIEALLDPGAVLPADLAVDVGDEREGKAVFLLEFVMARDAVLADTHYLRLELLEGRRGIAKAAGLGGAARRVVLGVKVKDDGL